MNIVYGMFWGGLEDILFSIHQQNKCYQQGGLERVEHSSTAIFT